MITGTVSCPLDAHSLSSVTPSVSGIQISSRTRSGVSATRSWRATAAFSAVTTAWPSSERISDRSSRMPTSSSTTRMVAIRGARRCRQGMHLHAAGSGNAPARTGRDVCSDRLYHAPENDGYARAATGGHAAIDELDASSVFVDDFFHHRQTQAGAAGFGCDIGFKGTPKYIRGKPGAVILDREAHRLLHTVGRRTRFIDGDGLGAHDDSTGAHRTHSFAQLQGVVGVGKQVVDH